MDDTFRASQIPRAPSTRPDLPEREPITPSVDFQAAPRGSPHEHRAARALRPSADQLARRIEGRLVVVGAALGPRVRLGRCRRPRPSAGPCTRDSIRATCRRTVPAARRRNCGSRSVRSRARSPAAREALQLPLHERRQRPRPLLAAPQKLRQVPTHQHRRVALVGLTRHVADRPRAPGHLARLCIRPAARRRSPSRRNCYARRGRSITWRPAGAPPWPARRTTPPRPRLHARRRQPLCWQRLTASARPARILCVSARTFRINEWLWPTWTATRMRAAEKKSSRASLSRAGSTAMAGLTVTNTAGGRCSSLPAAPHPPRCSPPRP
jgi:hypothetical protein